MSNLATIIMTNVGGAIRLTGPDSALDLKYDLGDLRATGLAGRAARQVTFSEYVQHDQEPDVLAYLRRNEGVDLTYTVDGTSVGSADKVLLIARGCTLADVSFAESNDGSRLQYTLNVGRYEGYLIPGLGTV